jgi:hypothetical protein
MTMDTNTLTFADPAAIGEALTQQFGGTAEAECVVSEIARGKTLRARGTRDAATGTWTWTLLCSGVRVSGGSARNRIGCLAGMTYCLDACTTYADHNPTLADETPTTMADKLAGNYQKELALLSEQDLRRARWENLKRSA